jgi:mannose-6-phosphate isomerase-like protein (cupin superfamily)
MERDMKLYLLIFLLNAVFYSQNSITNVFEIKKADNKEIDVHRLYSDSLSSSYVIYIEKEVKAHHHKTHTELLYVLSGTGVFRLADKKQIIKEGNYIAIPRGVTHGVEVTSKEPLKVISIQTPEFMGKDRHF